MPLTVVEPATRYAREVLITESDVLVEGHLAVVKPLLLGLQGFLPEAVAEAWAVFKGTGDPAHHLVG